MTVTENIYLTGYRGTGKTSVGKILADRMGRPLVDLDELIESTHGKTIREIFDSGGETLFRNLEAACLKEVADRSGEIVALGGGAILRKENRDLITNSGKCVWLDADAQTIADRIYGDETTQQRRPALTQLGQMEEIRTLLTKRESRYQEASQYRIDTAGKTVQEIASQIEDWLQTAD